MFPRSDLLHVMGSSAPLQKAYSKFHQQIGGSNVPEDLLATTLDEFVSKAWGNPQAFVKRLDPQGIEFIDVSKYFIELGILFSMALRPVNNRILVRDEYRAALEALEYDRYDRGVCVIGQAGIGQTDFLLYALVHWLHEEQTVAVQFLTGQPYYALMREGSVTVHHLDDLVPLSNEGCTWALCDSNAHTTIPPGLFETYKRTRIMQTTFPKASSWKEWTNRHGSELFIMDIWSEQEIIQLATLLRLDVERMTTLARKFGGVPRTLMKCLSFEDSEEIDAQYRESARVAVRECPAMISGGAKLDFPSDELFPFYFIRPGKSLEGGVHRQRIVVCVPTPTLRRFLAEALQGQTNSVKLAFYNALGEHEGTRQTAAFIYESWFHSFFVAEHKIACQWIAHRLDQGPDLGIAHLPITLDGTRNRIATTWDAFESAKAPFYWVAPTGFPGIHSVLVLKTEIFAFQVIVSSEFESPIKGLELLQEHLPANLQKHAWRVVLVGAEEQGPMQRVALKFAGDLFLPATEKGSRVHVPVGWATVDPVQRDVTYEVYRDESQTYPVEPLKKFDEEVMDSEVDTEEEL